MALRSLDELNKRCTILTYKKKCSF